jgi:hypothetical protein
MSAMDRPIQQSQSATTSAEEPTQDEEEPEKPKKKKSKKDPKVPTEEERPLSGKGFDIRINGTRLGQLQDDLESLVRSSFALFFFSCFSFSFICSTSRTERT